MATRLLLLAAAVVLVETLPITQQDPAMLEQSNAIVAPVAPNETVVRAAAWYDGMKATTQECKMGFIMALSVATTKMILVEGMHVIFNALNSCKGKAPNLKSYATGALKAGIKTCTTDLASWANQEAERKSSVWADINEAGKPIIDILEKQVAPVSVENSISKMCTQAMDVWGTTGTYAPANKVEKAIAKTACTSILGSVVKNREKIISGECDNDDDDDDEEEDEEEDDADGEIDDAAEEGIEEAGEAAADAGGEEVVEMLAMLLLL